jgi:NADH-quinone oxidoreductase subunit G
MPFSSDLNVLELGLLPGVNFYNHRKLKRINKTFYYLLGADEFLPIAETNECFFVYQGHHGDKLAKKANVILPGLSFLEKNSSFLNLQGFSQGTNLVVSPLQTQVKND